MSKFKKGDEVVCLKNTYEYSSYSFKYGNLDLAKNQETIIDAVDGDTVLVMTNHGQKWKSVNLFRHYKPKRTVEIAECTRDGFCDEGVYFKDIIICCDKEEYGCKDRKITKWDERNS